MREIDADPISYSADPVLTQHYRFPLSCNERNVTKKCKLTLLGLSRELQLSVASIGSECTSSQSLRKDANWPGHIPVQRNSLRSYDAFPFRRGDIRGGAET